MATYNFTIYPPSTCRGLIKILTGQRFGRLLVLGYAGSRQGAYWHCLCDCGNGVTCKGERLTFGTTKSCGCYGREQVVKANTKLDKKSGTSEYWAFQNAKSRCTRPNHPEYPNYGGRGIEFRFTSFEEFYTELKKRPSARHSVNRINNNGHYELGNIEWSLSKPQGRNKRNNVLLTAFGETLCMAEWAERTNMTWKTLKHRVSTLKWCTECAVTLPLWKKDKFPRPSCPHRE